MKSSSKTITGKEITKRSELLLTALQLLREEPNMEMSNKDFTELLKTGPNAALVSGTLARHHIISIVINGRKPSTVKYTGIEPNLMICKKVIEDSIERSRNFNVKNKAKIISNKVQSAKELTEIKVKPAPLHYESFLREIKVLKERYKMTVPNAEIEVVVRVSSNATV
jgi:hypothetical protein